MPHTRVLTGSTVLPPHRVCGDGFGRARRAGISRYARPGGRFGAVEAHSAPSAHTGRRRRTLGAASAHSTPSKHTRRRRRTLGAASAHSTPSKHTRRRRSTLGAVSAHRTPSKHDKRTANATGSPNNLHSRCETRLFAWSPSAGDCCGRWHGLSAATPRRPAGRRCDRYARTCGGWRLGRPGAAAHRAGWPQSHQPSAARRRLR